MKKTIVTLTIILFIFLLLLSSVWAFYHGKFSSLFHYLMLGIILVGFVFLLFLFLFIVSAILLDKGYQNLILLKFNFWGLRLFFPLLLLIGRFKREYRIQIQREFINLNNLLVENLFLKNGKKFKSVMILLPHCLQWSDCPLKITYDVENCKKCGKCDIAGLLKLAEKYGLKMFVATGGTLARRIIKDNRPDFIIACACEEDLSLGIFDVRKIPVYGVLNERPFGPCFNTKISVEKVGEVLEKLFP